MTRIVGIIPAGGKAERFNGTFKELLPTRENECGLSRCIDSMLRADATHIVIASASPTHRAVSQRYQLNLTGFYPEFLTIQFVGLWEFIAYVGKEYIADYYYFAMPDTVYPIEVFEQMPVGKAVVMGEFLTRQPNRFGVVWNGHIMDKSVLPGKDMYPAWGVWCWNRDAMEFLANAMQLYKDHSLALDELIQRFGFVSVHMPYYYDFATFEDYQEYLCQSTRTRKNTE